VLQHLGARYLQSRKGPSRFDASSLFATEPPSFLPQARSADAGVGSPTHRRRRTPLKSASHLLHERFDDTIAADSINMEACGSQARQLAINGLNVDQNDSEGALRQHRNGGQSEALGARSLPPFSSRTATARQASLQGHGNQRRTADDLFTPSSTRVPTPPSRAAGRRNHSEHQVQEAARQHPAPAGRKSLAVLGRVKMDTTPSAIRKAIRTAVSDRVPGTGGRGAVRPQRVR